MEPPSTVRPGHKNNNNTTTTTTNCSSNKNNATADWVQQQTPTMAASPQTSTLPSGKHLPADHFDAVAKTLDQMTTKAGEKGGHTKEHLHQPAHDEKSHALFRAVFPYKSLQDLETQWHLGNYVIDRKTGKSRLLPSELQEPVV